MKIVFLGTPEFAVASLDALIKAGHEIVGVITSTDKYGGRGNKKLLESAVKKYALEHGLRILQPPRLKNKDFLAELASLGAELQVIVAFRMLPELVWNMPVRGTMNLHGSILPKYRGAAPINWAIMNDEKETGLSTFMLQHQIDTGDILMQHLMPIGVNETAGELHDRMMIAGADLVVRSVRAMEEGSVEAVEQDHSLACPAPKLNSGNTVIDWTKTSMEVHNHIRGLSPYPGSWTEVDGVRMKIFRTVIGPENLCADGFFKHHGRLFHSCGFGTVEILELQPAGKRRMNAEDYLRGRSDIPEVDK